MNGALLYVAAHPFAYQVTALALLGVFAVCALTVRVPMPAFLVVAAATFVAWRWPVFLYPAPLNPDEAQMTANALKATVDPLPWHGFDPTTSGPLNSDILALPAIVGLRIDFVSTRLIGAAFVVGALVALYYAVTRSFGGRVARIALVPPVLFFASTTDWDFVHYSSEHLPFFLLTVALAACIELTLPSARRVIASAIAGFCIGAIPFAKLQAVPIALLLALFAAVAIASHRSVVRVKRIEAAVAVGALSVPAFLIAGALVATGELSDAVVSYIRWPASYIAGGAPVGLDFFLNGSGLAGIGGYRSYAWCSLAVIAFGIVAAGVYRARVAAAVTGPTVFYAASAAPLLGAAAFAVYEPHRLFPHYLLLLIFPLAWCVAVILGIGSLVGAGVRRVPVAAPLFVALFAVPVVAGVLGLPNPFVIALPAATQPYTPPELAIRRYAAAGDAMVVWGWMPEYFVDAGTIMSTRTPNSTREIEPGPFRAYFRARFMADIAARPPRVIVDAVAPDSFAYKDRATAGIETFAPLAKLLRERYVLKEDVAGVRIFIAKGV